MVMFDLICKGSVDMSGKETSAKLMKIIMSPPGIGPANLFFLAGHLYCFLSNHYQSDALYCRVLIFPELPLALLVTSLYVKYSGC